MPSLFEIQTITRQFFRVESELSVLKAMVRELVLGNAPPNAPLTVEQPPTEAPEPRAPQHFDGKHWRPGPSPEPGTVTDRTVGIDVGQG